MGIALVLLPISFTSAAFGFEAGGGDHLMDVVGAMDMVAGDVAATADEGGEAESAPSYRPGRRGLKSVSGCSIHSTASLFCMPLEGRVFTRYRVNRVPRE